MMRKLSLLAGVAGLVLGTGVASSGAATAPSGAAYTARLMPVPHDAATATRIYGGVNGTNASGVAYVIRHGNQIRVVLVARGLSPNLPHAMHIHGDVNGNNVCPGLDSDANHDGVVDTLEGVPDYGGIDVSLTKTGGTSGGLLPDGLALDRFPVANRGGVVVYQRTITVSDDVAAHLGNLHIVVHGADLNGDGHYDGPLSSLNAALPPGANVPLEAELPVACGTLSPIGASSSASGSM